MRLDKRMGSAHWWANWNDQDGEVFAMSLKIVVPMVRLEPTTYALRMAKVAKQSM